jgi:hypothetical protein
MRASRPPLPLGLLLPLLLLGLWMAPLPGGWLAPAWAGPVEWREVPATAEGQQWWDAGSLHRDRQGQLSVLSRFLPASSANGTLYVMQIDCDQNLFRDVSVNGLPRFRAEWQPVAEDELGAAVIREACAAWSDPSPS